jgi:hypothetical protein
MDPRGNGNGNRETGNGNRDHDPELERYWEALNQLEWCIDYLYRVQKGDIARALARNRSKIVKRIR